MRKNERGTDAGLLSEEYQSPHLPSTAMHMHMHTHTHMHTKSLHTVHTYTSRTAKHIHHKTEMHLRDSNPCLQKIFPGFRLFAKLILK